MDDFDKRYTYMSAVIFRLTLLTLNLHLT